ncbi:MAG: hypothetical protein ACXVAE_03065 [Candidatus Limnocylindrales bacterium]
MKKLFLAVLIMVALAASATVAYAGSGGNHGHHDRWTAISVTNPNNPAQVSHKLVREKTPLAVFTQHITALNHCDWLGLMQQYPDQYQLRQGGPGALVQGRLAAAATFAGFVKPHAAGGLCGGTFTTLSMQIIDETVAVSWEFNAPFLAVPYFGADAYITDDGLMISMVSTFDGTQLQFKP